MLRRASTRRRFAFALLSALLLLATGLWLCLRLIPRPPSDVVTLVRVADGDTLVVRTSRGEELRVRLLGVDAPELGTAASFRSALHAAELCEAARQIRLEVDPVSPRDRYGRALAWVWLRLSDDRTVLLNEEMIRRGGCTLHSMTSRRVKHYDRLR